MEIVLTPEMEAFIQDRIQSGKYKDAGEVMKDALRSLERNAVLESPYLAVMLLEAFEEKAEPLTEDTLEEVRKLARDME